MAASRSGQIQLGPLTAQTMHGRHLKPIPGKHLKSAMRVPKELEDPHCPEDPTVSDPPIALRMLLGVSAFALVLASLSLLTIEEPANPAPVAVADAVDGVQVTSHLAAATADETMTDPLPPPPLRQLGVIPVLSGGQSASGESAVSNTGEMTIPENPTTTAPPTTVPAAPPPTAKPKPSGSAPSGPTVTYPQGSSGPVTINGEQNVVLENMSISNPGGPCVRIISSSNVTIRNSSIGPCGDWGVFIDKSSGVTITGVTIQTGSGKGGVYGHSSTGVAVVGNKITASGRNPVQFDKVTGAGNRIESNTITNSRAEDMISVYKSGGTSGSWLRITGNTVKDNTGQSNTGSGIMLGDSGGGYVLVQGNKLTNPGQAGIGVAGGTNIRVLSNTVSSAQFPWSNVGIYVWNQASSCGAIEVRGNSVNWVNKSGQSNPAWDGGGCGSIAGWGDNSW
jgi:hypothetical protein